MSIIVAGKNDFQQILQGKNERQMIKVTKPTPKTSQYRDLSYSAYNEFAISVGEDNTPYGIGNNKYISLNPIFGKHIEVFYTFFGIHFKRKTGSPLRAESAVCGLNYSLFLSKEIENEEDKNHYLVYVLGKKSSIHNYDFLDTYGYRIISIYGGSQISAAIDERGAIHIITNSIFSDPNRHTHVTFLPESELPVFIAFQGQSILALSSRGNVYEYLQSEFDETNYFHIVPELIGKQCISLSGVNEHSLVVTKNGMVFGRGSNEFKQLARKNKRFEKFVHIKSLDNKDITSVYAGAFHSLFVDKKGALYTCGTNKFGEAMIKNAQLGKTIDLPTLTDITQDVKFCIAGTNFSIAYLDAPPQTNSNLKIQLASSFPYPLMFQYENNDMLLKIKELENTLSKRAKQISLLEKELNSIKNEQNQHNEEKNSSNKVKKPKFPKNIKRKVDYNKNDENHSHRKNKNDKNTLDGASNKKNTSDEEINDDEIDYDSDDDRNNLDNASNKKIISEEEDNDDEIDYDSDVDKNNLDETSNKKITSEEETNDEEADDNKNNLDKTSNKKTTSEEETNDDEADDDIKNLDKISNKKTTSEEETNDEEVDDNTEEFFQNNHGSSSDDNKNSGKNKNIPLKSNKATKKVYDDNNYSSDEDDDVFDDNIDDFN